MVFLSIKLFSYYKVIRIIFWIVNRIMDVVNRCLYKSLENFAMFEECEEGF